MFLATFILLGSQLSNSLIKSNKISCLFKIRFFLYSYIPHTKVAIPTPPTDQVINEQSGEDIFDETKDEDEDETQIEIPQEKRKNIHFKTPTRTVRDIHHSYKTNELDPRPPFQRGFVWDMKKASRTS